MSRRKKKHALEEPAELPQSASSANEAEDTPAPDTYELPPQPADELPDTDPDAPTEANDVEVTAVVDDPDDAEPEDTKPEDSEPASPIEADQPADQQDDAPEPETAEKSSADAESTPATEISTERVVEAILFATEEPLPPAKVASILGTGSAREVRKIIQKLNADYTKAGHAFRIEEIAGGYQMLTLPDYNTWLRRLRQTRQDSKLTPAAMETLAIVAYKQPVVRAEIEAVRGVSVGEVLNRLRELGLVKIVGRAEDVGRPMLYGTTKRFLELFGLGSLDDLPAIEELQMPK